MRLLLGTLMNWAGAPGFVREAEYENASGELKIRVRRFGAFTVISVNRLDLRFRRVTGSFAGASMPPGCASEDETEPDPDSHALAVKTIR